MIVLEIEVVCEVRIRSLLMVLSKLMLFRIQKE